MRLRALFVVALACTSLSACSTLAAIPASPSVVANATVLDEQAATGAEIAYKAFRVAVKAYVTGYGVSPETAGKLRTINNQAYGLLGSVRRAYNAGNATSYNSALSDLYGSIAQGYAIIKGN
jgi:hypothetical protein